MLVWGSVNPKPSSLTPNQGVGFAVGFEWIGVQDLDVIRSILLGLQRVLGLGFWT